MTARYELKDKAKAAQLLSPKNRTHNGVICKALASGPLTLPALVKKMGRRYRSGAKSVPANVRWHLYLLKRRGIVR